MESEERLRDKHEPRALGTVPVDRHPPHPDALPMRLTATRPLAPLYAGLTLLAIPVVAGAPVQDAAQDDESPAPYRLELPDSPEAKVWAAVGADTRPAGLPGPDPAAADWNEASTWRRWASLVAAEKEAPKPTPERRAVLCLLASAHGRVDDAWGHLARLGPAPEWAAAVTAFLLPGVPPGTQLGPGGEPLNLAAGTLLRPIPPPDSGTLPPGVVEWRTARIEGLTVGGATVDLAITIESSGVQVDATHAAGDATRLSVLLPAPERFQVQVEYLDWMRLDTVGQAVELELSPGAETRTVYGRTRESRSDLPTGRATTLPGQLLEGALFLELATDDPDREHLTAVAQELESLLGVSVRLRTAAERVANRSSGGTGITLSLPPGEGRAQRLRYLASAVERFLLGQEH